MVVDAPSSSATVHMLGVSSSEGKKSGESFWSKHRLVRDDDGGGPAVHSISSSWPKAVGDLVVFAFATRSGSAADLIKQGDRVTCRREELAVAAPPQKGAKRGSKKGKKKMGSPEDSRWHASAQAGRAKQDSVRVVLCPLPSA